MDQIIKYIAWPIAVIIFGIFFCLRFKKQIAALIDRISIKKVRKGGLEMFKSQPLHPIREKKGLEEFYRNYGSPLLNEAEQRILDDLKNRNIDSPADREKALLRALASLNIVLNFEQISGMLFASQWTFLLHLNPLSQGVLDSEIKFFYEWGRNNYPKFYENYQFEMWLGFLEEVGFIEKRDSRVSITVGGREFIKYIISVGKPAPYFG